MASNRPPSTPYYLSLYQNSPEDLPDEQRPEYFFPSNGPDISPIKHPDDLDGTVRVSLGLDRPLRLPEDSSSDENSNKG